ncbi:site-specific integrase [Ascidiaceihabitans sp.]|uniref:site-specific integrase n=1 Tax=Ascidiaceihabitans sp. TaxID=1872644 RepID=UPI0032979B13
MNPRVSVPKTFLRGNKWYVRVQVPKSMQERLKRKEYWVSLRTSDRAEALQHATAATQKKRREISAVYRRLSAIKETFYELDADQQLALGREAYATHVSGNADLIAEFKASNFETLKAFTEARSDTVDDVIARLRLARSDTPHIRIMAYKLMEENDIRLPEGSVAFQQLLEICADTFIEAKRNELAKLAGRAVHDAPNPQYVDTVTGGPKSYVSLGDQLALPPEPTPSLTALMEAFLDNPNKLRTVKTKKSIRGYLGVVFQILGDETLVDEISEDDCERVRDLIAKLPPNFMKLPDANKRTIEELAALAERKGMAKLSPTGVNNYLRWLMTFLSWCHRKGKMNRMPTAYAEIKVADPVRREDKRAAFSNDQLNVIFRSQVYQDQERSSSLFWVPLIAIWNGMRSNEICQLDVADIKLEENVWGFDVTHISTTGDDDKSVKTGSSVRFVPMHPKLIEFGFLDFHNARPPKAKLFGDITRGSDGYYSTNFSKKVNRYLKGIGAHGPKHKFHSFRHNFRDALRRGRVDREIGKALGGWTGRNTDAFDIYGNGYGVDELKDEISLVDYPHVNWSKV